VPVLGITGGIASGKSSFTKRIAPLLRGRVFDADREARRLLENDSDVRAALLQTFGPRVLQAGETGDAPATVDRAWLRETVFGDREARRKLEGILHPAIRKVWMGEARKAREEREWLVLDIPLLYETGAEGECDRVAVVACRTETQRQRIISERGLTAAMADRMLAAQQPLEEKIKRAPHVIWSEGAFEILEHQAALFAAYLQERYG